MTLEKPSNTQFDGFFLFSLLRGSCKTPRPRKIDDFESVCQPLKRPGPIPEHILQASRARGWGGKMAQKGDFAVAVSFATASFSCRISHQLI